jgi:exodeoxyribonuclease VII large subunit
MHYNEEVKIFSISEVTGIIKSLFDQNFQNITIKGEISNYKKHTSGHIYFTLKDESAQISAVIWRGNPAGLKIPLQDGMNVIAKGSITVYEPQGKYQIIINNIQPVGVGELQLAFERLKKKLQAEGLFDEEHKKPLPEYPEAIGIVTSSTGAAIRDLVSVISRRYPKVNLLIYPVNVQGSGSAEEIAEAIKIFNEYKKVDALIVGRGGGSLEDLWAFNEEVVARAIYDSEIPVISAVGHQIDFTISDFVADVRAATPSAAGELAVPDGKELSGMILELQNSLYTSIKDNIDSYRERVKNLIRSYSFNKPIDILRRYQQKLDDIVLRIETSTTHRINIYKEKNDSFNKRLLALNPRSILNRGYVMVKLKDEIIASAKSLQINDDVGLEFRDGIRSAKIQI